MNAPPTFESFLLFDGEKKITKEQDTKVPNASIFTINKEDHTLGNLIRYMTNYSWPSRITLLDTSSNFNILRCQLLKDPNVLFAGYKNPHPLENKVILRIQTTSDYTPQVN